MLPKQAGTLVLISGGKSWRRGVLEATSQELTELSTLHELWQLLLRIYRREEIDLSDPAVTERLKKLSSTGFLLEKLPTPGQGNVRLMPWTTDLLRLGLSKDGKRYTRPDVLDS